MAEQLSVEMIVKAISEGFEAVLQSVDGLGKGFDKSAQLIVDASGKVRTVSAQTGADVKKSADAQARAFEDMSKRMELASNLARQKYEEQRKEMEALSSTATKLAVGFGAVAAAGGVLLGSSIRLAARVETLGVVTARLGQNVGMTEVQVRGLEEAIKKKGITTQAARQSIALMIQAEIDLAHATQLARIAQDAAVIANMNSSEAFNTLVYAISSGNVRMLRTLGIQVLFEDAYSKMAETLGKNTDALTDQERVQARVNVVLEAGKNIAGSYEAAMSTAGKQLLSLDRHLEESRRMLGEMWLPAFAAVIASVTESLEWWEKLDTEQQNIVSGTLGVITAFSAVEATLLGMVALLPKVIAGLQGLTLTLGATTIAAGALFAGITVLAAVIVALGALWIAQSQRNMEATNALKAAELQARETAKSYEEYAAAIDEANKAQEGGFKLTEQGVIRPGVRGGGRSGSAGITIINDEVKKLTQSELENLDVEKLLADQRNKNIILHQQLTQASATFEAAQRKNTMQTKLGNQTSRDAVEIEGERVRTLTNVADRMDHVAQVQAGLAAGLRGELAKATEQYTETVADLLEKKDELLDKLKKTERRYGKNSEKAKELREQIAGLADDEREAAEALAEATAQMIYQQASADLDAEYALQLARAMGLISEADYNIAAIIEQLNRMRDAGAISNQKYVDSVLNLHETVSGLQALSLPIDPTLIGLAAGKLDELNKVVEAMERLGIPTTVENIAGAFDLLSQKAEAYDVWTLPEANFDAILTDMGDTIGKAGEVETSITGVAEKLSALPGVPDTVDASVDELKAKVDTVGTAAEVAKPKVESMMSGIETSAGAAQTAVNNVTAAINNIPTTRTVTVNVVYVEGQVPGRQTGGPVAPGIPYKVHRDETVVFDRPGYVIPVSGRDAISQANAADVTGLPGAGAGRVDILDVGDIIIVAPNGADERSIAEMVLTRLTEWRRRSSTTSAFYAGS